MKKFLVILAAVLTFSAAAAAQPRAIGARLGGSFDISYQHYAGGMNFIEADLGFFPYHGNSFYLSGVYDFNIGNAGDFNFYAGPGVQLGGNTTGFSLGICGQVGAEYAIPGVPLNLSLDWKPYVNFINGFGFQWLNLALGIRYRF